MFKINFFYATVNRRTVGEKSCKGGGILEKMGIAGNGGKGIKNDCLVKFRLKDSGGIEINIKSKVELFFKDHYEKLIREELQFFGIENCVVELDDAAAYDFVIMARLEAAIKQVVETTKEYLPDMNEKNLYNTAKEKTRRTRLYLPGNTPKYMINAGLHHPDGVILDLEDSVSYDKKDEARILVRNALRSVDFYGAERMARINQLPMGLTDLDFLVPHNVNLILIPKCESKEEVKTIENRIFALREKHNIKNNIWLMPILESAKGVMNAYEIATSSENIVALAIGLEDYTADIGVARTDSGSESLFARMMLVNAAKAAGILAIDSVFSEINDMKALEENVKRSKALGFDGMGVIHPRQIPVIERAFLPTEKELEKAKKIVLAFKKAEKEGLGVVTVGSKMVDPPVVKRAMKTIDDALKAGLISENWEEENE